MKIRTYTYKDKQYEVKGKYFKKYVRETKVDLKKVYPSDESLKILSSHILPPYKDAVRCNSSLSGRDICEYLAYIEETFDIRLEESVED